MAVMGLSGFAIYLNNEDIQQISQKESDDEIATLKKELEDIKSQLSGINRVRGQINPFCGGVGNIR